MRSVENDILNIEHVSKIFGEKTIFDDVSFGIQERDKIGIIGINGTGKTTGPLPLQVWRSRMRERL